MIITFEEKSNKFVIKCEDNIESRIVMAMPDRRFRKATRTWGAPALRRNIEYMRKHIGNIHMYSPEAQEVYNRPIKKPTVTNNGWPGWYTFKTYQPMEHQARCMNKAIDMDEYAILFEQGLGKTFTAINLAAAWRLQDQIDSVVVICPSSIKLVWEDELNIHCPIPFQAHIMKAGKYKQATKFIDKKDDFQVLVVGVEALSQGSAHEYLEKFLLTRNCLIVIDESSRIKTPNKTRTDRCIAFGKMAKKRLILSGTSVTQGIEDLYTQFRFLNPDIVGFDSFYTFKANYCVTMQMQVSEYKWVAKIVGYQNEDELIKSIAPYTSRVEKADALDLPEKIYQNRFVEMTPTQRRVYQEMKDELFLEIEGEEFEVESVLEQTLRLQQITGGFYPFDDGEKVEPKPIPGANPKLNELMAILDEVPGKVIIWCQFRAEIDAVAERLRKANIQTVQFHGGCDDDEKAFAVKSLRDDPETRVFLATRAAAYGLTLTAASNAIYYSQGYSLEEYEQSQDRIHRIGQGDKCNYIHLLCASTVDTKVITALRNKKSVATMVYDSMKAEQ